MIGTLVRDRDAIIEETKAIAEYKDRRSDHFGRLTYEDGVAAAIKWLFYEKEPAPSDVSPTPKPVVVSRDSMVTAADPSGDY